MQTNTPSGLLAFLIMVAMTAITVAQEPPFSPIVSGIDDAVSTSPDDAPGQDTPDSDPEETGEAVTEDIGLPKDSDEREDSDEVEDSDEPEEVVRLPLTPEMLALRERLRRVTAHWQTRRLNLQTNTPGEILAGVLAFGCEGLVDHNGRPINAVGSLCWNYPCAGHRLLRSENGRIVAMVGHGSQREPSEFLAVMARSRVAPDYELRVGDARGTIHDLIEHEKRTCRVGGNSSLKLIALACYLPNETTWENDLGETWSLERLVEDELNREVDQAQPKAVDHLTALSYAAIYRKHRGGSSDGIYEQATDLVRREQAHALDLQNPDGSWHPNFFSEQGTVTDPFESLRATGPILAWLAFSLPESEIQDPKITLGIEHLLDRLGNRLPHHPISSMTPRQIDSVMRALHALSVHDRRALTER